MKIYSEIAPCKDCQKREVGCHSTCKDYINWKASGREQPKNYGSIRSTHGKTTWDKFYKNGK